MIPTAEPGQRNPAHRIRRAYADTALGQVHYRWAGDPGARPLLLLHQAPSSSAMWEPAMSSLAARGYYLVAPDLLGHGGSDPAPPGPTLRQYVAGVWALVDTLKLTPSSLIGHHSGASVAALMAGDRPDWVRALALWGVPLLDSESAARLMAETPPDWAEVDTWLPQRWAIRRNRSGKGWTPEMGRRALLELIQAGPRTNELHNAVGATALEPLLPLLDQPMLVICGEQDVLFEASQKAAQLAAHGRFEPIHGAGLDVVDHQTEQFVSLVDDFLQSMSPRSLEPPKVR